MTNTRPQHSPVSGWQFRTLEWDETADIARVADCLEQLAANPALGPVCLEFHAKATKKAADMWWIVATKNPSTTRKDDIAQILTSHLPVRLHAPRKSRVHPMICGRVEFCPEARSIPVDRVHAAVRTIYGTVAGLKPGESITVQLLLGGRLNSTELHRPKPSSWLGFLSAPPKPAVAQSKTTPPMHGFNASLRIGADAVSTARSRYLVEQVFGALRVLETGGRRMRLKPERTRRLTSLIRPWRWPMHLSSSEAVGFTLWPSGSLPLPVIGSLHPKTVPAPSTYVVPTRLIGVSGAPDNPVPIGISLPDSTFHTQVLGPTGTGKSTVILNLLAQDLAGSGSVLLIDPKGDLARDALMHVPPERAADVVVIDPVASSPVGFNPLAATRSTPEVTADALLATFESVFKQYWGIRSADTLASAFLTLARIPGANLLWLPPLLTNDKFRHRVLKGQTDPLGTEAFWAQYEAKKPAARAVEIAPVLNKFRQIALRPGLRAILGQADPRFDLSDLFTKRRIVIVNLNKGRMGADAAKLLGSLIVGQLWNLILARADIPVSRRHVVSVYIDEASDFLAGIPTDLSDALAQSRSLGVAFTLANQYLSQFSPEMLQAVEANCRNKIVFGLNADAPHMAKLADSLEPQDFRLLPAYHAYASLMNQGSPTGWFSLRTNPEMPRISDPADIYAKSHANFGVPATDTEKAILTLITTNTTSPGPTDHGPVGRSKR